MTNEEIKKILIDGNYVTESDIAIAEKNMTRDDTLVGYLITMGTITEGILGQATAEFYHVPYSDMASNPAVRDRVLKIPEDVARAFRIVLVSADKNGFVFATDDPVKKDLDQVLKKLSGGQKYSIMYASPKDIDAAFLFYQKPLETRFSKIIKENTRVAPEIIDEIIGDAVTLHASDIHFEPMGEEVIIRFRVDGVMHEAGRIQKTYYDNILNRIKVQSKLRIDEHFAAQDGSVRYKRGDKMTDLRISVVPTVEGEKIVIRILGEYVRGFTLSDLGLSQRDEKLLHDAAEKPFGMILTTGPTGAGKTTTLYALLRLLNSPKVNVMTIEDPVEYHIAGVNQIQVNMATNLTFAKGLRSIVRQDPDIVLVGEIRDAETADIAVNAALTGHLMLSTFHANDAATAIPRLLNMGVEPFLLSSTLELIVAQRLVRRLCLHCRYSVEYTQADLLKKFKNADRYFTEKTETLYAGKGCDACNHTGFDGRTAIYEFIAITPEIQNLILNNPASTQVWEAARRGGARALFEDGIDKVKNGITTIEELLRVAEPPEDAYVVTTTVAQNKPSRAKRSPTTTTE